MKKLSLFFALVLSLCCSLTVAFVNVGAASQVVYDISEVSDVAAGGEFSPTAGSAYVGKKAIGYGETVKFGYKNSDTTKQLRMAFGIGAYGFYLYYNPDNAVSVYDCDMLAWSRRTILTTIDRALFTDFNTIELTLTEKDGAVVLSMNYSDGDERKTLTKEFTKNASDDRLFRFGDKNFAGNVVKSTVEPVSFGNGFTFTGENVSGLNIYGGSTLSVVAKEKAAEAGIPEGFTGDSVLVAESAKASFDMAFDFTSLNYKRSAILGISFRLYIEKNSADTSGYPEIRIPVDSAATSWIARYPIGSAKTGQWTTVSLSETEINQLCKDGVLGKFVFAVRANGIAKMYIDSVTVDVVPPDTEAPVITAPLTRFKVTEGTYPDLSFITATDDSGVVEFEYEWSENALDYNGRLKAGNHTCTVKAIDPSNNVAQVMVNFEVIVETPAEIYSLIFRQDGKPDQVVEYTRGTEEYIVVPELDAVSKRYYNLVGWKAFELEYKANQVVEAEYMPIVYTVTYVADGVTVGTITYTIESFNFDIPAVPQKEGYAGVWEEHDFMFEDLTVNAIYTEKPVEPDSGSDSASDSSEVLESCSSSISSLPLLFVMSLAAVAVFAVKRKARKE